jgi:hypothetical protein
MLRRLGFPAGTRALALFDRDAGIKVHPSYKAAKSGDAEAALTLVSDLAGDWLFQQEGQFKSGTVFVAPHAKEASGDKAIPQTLSTLCVSKDVRLIKERFRDEFTEIFGINPDALTANEARYLVGFRSIDAIRDRLAAAKQEIDLRLRSKGLSRSGGFSAGLQAEGTLSGHDSSDTPYPSP